MGTQDAIILSRMAKDNIMMMMKMMSNGGVDNIADKEESVGGDKDNWRS